MSEKLSEEERTMLQYFWKEKSDLERFSKFDELKPKLKNEHPLILKAWNDYKTSIAILDLAMEHII